MPRWGIIATGGIAAKFATELNELPDAPIAAVGSRSRENAEAFASRFHAAKAYGSYEEVARDPEVDIVYIATPHPFHCANTLLCLEHGKHVLCEKPFAINAADAERMVRTARERKRFLMEAMWTRFLPVMVELRRLVDEKAIGEVRSIESDFGFRSPRDPKGRMLDPALGGGALLDIGIYNISFAHWILGAPDEVKSWGHLGPTGVDEQNSVLFGYKDGRTAVLHTSIQAETFQEAMLVGTEGYIRVHRYWWCSSALTLNRNGKDEVISPPKVNLGYKYEAMEAARCLAEGRLESLVMPLDETLSIMRIMDGLRKEWGLSYPMEKGAVK